MSFPSDPTSPPAHSRPRAPSGPSTPLAQSLSRPWPRRVAVLLGAMALVLTLSGVTTLAQEGGEEGGESLGLIDDGPRLGTAREMDAVDAIDRRKYVRARELATAVLEADPDSIPGLFAMASSLHYGDGNLPRAIFLIGRARQLLEKRTGLRPSEPVDRYWTERILMEQAQIAADMDDREKQLEALRRRDKLFEPRPGDQIWPLIKLERWDEARRVIRKATLHQDIRQVFRGMNGLCALEFERRDRAAGYKACLTMAQRFENNEVAWSNTAESALTALRHDEAERYYLKATELFNNSYGSPWRSLAMVYLLEGRVTEALSALKRAQTQRMARDSYTHQQDQASMDTAAASLMVALGRGDDAERLGRRVYEQPDRAGGTSASAAQIELSGTLLFWNALHMRVAQLEERRAALSFWRRWWPDPELRAAQLELWTVERHAIALLADEERLKELLRPHLLGIVNIEVWMMGSVLRVLGAGVAREAIAVAQGAEDFDGVQGYFDAYLAEVELMSGDEDAALDAAQAALRSLPRAEVLLRARVAAVGGQAAHLSGDQSTRDRLWNQTLEDFPAAFRLLDLALPVTITHDGQDLTRDIASALRRSPRFRSEDSGLTIRVTEDGGGLRACMTRQKGALHGCAEIEPGDEDESRAELVARAADQFHDLIMSPKLDLSQADVRSLDGSLSTGRVRQQIDEVLDDL